jgi:hypothetical protein
MRQLECAHCQTPRYDLRHASCDRCRLQVRIQIYALRARLICEIKDERANAAWRERER